MLTCKKDKYYNFNKFKNNITQTKKFCLAPFSTLVFSQSGTILPCFYNKQIDFGYYYKGIDYFKLWKNSEFKTLRNRIKKKNLDFGCQICKYELDKGNYHTVYAQRYDYLTDFIKDQPINLEFQISNKCNFNCIMCTGENSSYVRNNREQGESYNSTYDSSFPESLIPLFPKIKELAFAGGEPFLIPEYKDIIEKARSVNSNIKYSFATNGSLFKSEDFDFFKNENVDLTISYESTVKEIFEEIRVNSNFETVHNNLIEANQILIRKNKTLSVKVCPLRQNIFDIPKTFLFLNSQNILVVFNTVLFPPKVALWLLNSNSLSEIVTFLKNVKLPTPQNKIQENNIHTYRSLINQISNWYQEAIVREDLLRKDRLAYNDILSKFMQKTKDYLAYYSVDMRDENSISAIPNVLSQIEDNNVRLKCLLYLNYLPIHYIISEINFRSKSKMADRIMQIAHDFSNLKLEIYG